MITLAEKTISLDLAWTLAGNLTWEVAELRQQDRGRWIATAQRRKVPGLDVMPWFIDGRGDSPIAALLDLAAAVARST